MSPARARLVTEYARFGPARGADRAVLLAHGAGADMHAPALAVFAEHLARAGIPSLRFHYPYRTAGRRAPDRPAVLAAATREAAAELARRTRLPPERLVVGGRSMGGRYASLAIAGADPGGAAPLPALGLLLLGYPLHAAGRTEQPRADHFPRITVPTLFVSGTADALASRQAMARHARRIRGRVAFHWIERADHGFKTRRSSGVDPEAALAAAAGAAATWVAAL